MFLTGLFLRHCSDSLMGKTLTKCGAKTCGIIIVKLSSFLCSFFDYKMTKWLYSYPDLLDLTVLNSLCLHCPRSLTNLTWSIFTSVSVQYEGPEMPLGAGFPPPPVDNVVRFGWARLTSILESGKWLTEKKMWHQIMAYLMRKWPGFEPVFAGMRH